jgi:CubicO group peptidase (beta-lactamase class C family)
MRHQFDSIKALINSKLVEMTVPSLAVAVAIDKDIIWEEGFGWANREKRLRSNHHIMYSLASISKPITATGLMVLVDQDKIALDKPVNDYLGDAKLKAWVGDPDEVTVRRVANHSSGLPLHYHFFCEDEPYTKPSMDETIRRYGNLVTAPGEKYQYANLGYGILDYVISRVSGKSYADFMRQEVFLPLNMTRASVNIGTGLEKYQAIRYGYDGLPIPFYDFDHPGASAVYCSAHDLVNFGMFHLKSHLPDQKAIISDEAIHDMQIPTAEIDVDSGYGIGWRINRNDSVYLSVSHTGGMGGVSTVLKLIPSEKLAVVALANSASSLPHLICKEILSVLLPNYTQEEEQKREEESVFKPTPELTGKWSGSVHTYRGEIPIILLVKESGDIHVKLGDQLWTLLNDVKFNDDYLSGRMMGDIGTEDANRRKYYLNLSLKLRGQVMNGVMTAISLPGQKMGNALSHWMEIKKVE